MTAPLLVALGCSFAPLRPRPAPTPEEITWRVVSGPTMDLWTDLPEDDAAVTLQRLEAFRSLLDAHMFVGAAVPPPTRKAIVVAFAGEEEWSSFGARADTVSGLFAAPENQPFPGPLVAFLATYARHELGRAKAHRAVVVTEQSSDPIIASQHEIGHLVLRAALPGAPEWLNEGMPQYFQAARIADDLRSADYGGLEATTHDRLLASGILPLAPIVGNAIGDTETQAFYLTSMLFVSFLVNVHPDELASYLRALQKVTPAERPAVWPRQFSLARTQELEAELHAWLPQARAAVHHVALPDPPSPPAPSRPLPVADLLAVRGFLYESLAGSSEARLAALHLLRDCNRDAPTHLPCAILLLLVDSSAKIDARALVAANPDEWRAWGLLALRLPPGEEKDAAFRRSCELQRAVMPSTSRECQALLDGPP